MGVADSLKIGPSSPVHMCYSAEFGRSTSNGTSVIKEIRLKNDPSRPASHGDSRSSEPSRIDPPPVTSYIEVP